MAENKYSYLVGSYRRAMTDSYQAQSPENSFEDTVQSLFLQGQGHQQHEEYNLASPTCRRSAYS